MIVLVYVAYIQGTNLLLISSAWSASAVVLALGTGCAICAASDLYGTSLPRSGQVCRIVVTMIGTIAVTAGVTGLITASDHALEILVVTSIALWGTGTFWHVLTIGSEQ